jgi:hypothetical protein
MTVDDVTLVFIKIQNVNIIITFENIICSPFFVTDLISLFLYTLRADMHYGIYIGYDVIVLKPLTCIICFETRGSPRTLAGGHFYLIPVPRRVNP